MGYVDPHLPDADNPYLEPLRVQRGREERRQMRGFDRQILMRDIEAQRPKIIDRTKKPGAGDQS